MFEFIEVPGKNLKKKFEVTISSEVVNKNFKEKLDQRQKQSKYPGFRPGKAPLWVVKNDEKNTLEHGNINDSLFYDVVLKEAYSFCDEIKKNQNLNIFNKNESITDIDVDSYKNAVFEDKDLPEIKFTYECELSPNIPEIKFEEIEVTDLLFEVTDDDIKQEIERLKQNWYKYENAQQGYTIKKNDKVICNLHGTIDGKDFEQGKVDNIEVTVGSHEIVNELEDALIGMKAEEEKFVDVLFPDDYHDKAVAGQKANFHIKVISVKESKKFETDDDLADHFKLPNKEELNKFIHDKLVRECDNIVSSEMKEQIMEVLGKYNDFDVPESLLNGQKEILKKENAMLEGEELEAEGLKSSRMALILSSFANQHNISLNQEDVINHISEMMGNDIYANYMFNLYKRSKEFAHSVNIRIVERKIFEKLMRIVKKNEVISSVNEIIKKAEEIEEKELDKVEKVEVKESND